MVGALRTGVDIGARTSGDYSLAVRRPLEQMLRIPRDVLCGLVLLLASLTVTSVHAHEHQSISPLDEYVYIDYYAKVIHSGPAREGGMVEDYARHELGCRGIRMTWAKIGRLCRHPREYPSGMVPISGHTSAYIYTPLYFLSARIMAEPLVLAGVDLVEAGRMTGGIWLGLAAILLFVAMRRLRVHRLAALGVGLVLVGSMPAYWANSYISTDATAYAAGAVMVLMTTYLRSEVRRWPALSFVVLSAVVTWLKFQNIVAVSLAALALLLLAARDRRRAGGGAVRWYLRDRRVWVAIAAVGAAAAAQLSWMIVMAALAVGPAPSFGIAVPMKLSYLANNVFAFLPGAASGPDAGWAGGPIFAATSFVILGGLFAALVASHIGPLERRLAVAALVAALVSGPILSLIVWSQAGGYVTLPTRYGMPLIPALLTCAAVAASLGPRQARWLLLASGVVVATLSFGLTG